jgi:GMP synthase (glutamine-hydrolysing)
MKVVVIQHVVEEGLGRFEPLFAEKGAVVEMVRPEMPLPSLGDALIVLGGPMGVDEIDRDEVGMIRSSLAAKKPVLGICLGSQLLAKTLGAKVWRAEAKEIGWHDVFAESDLLGDVPRSWKALHWHGDVFDLPRGAVQLARSEMTAHQAFSYDGIALGILFHPEVGRVELEKMIRAFPEDVSDPERLLADADRYGAESERAGRAILSRWLTTTIATSS